MPNVEILSDRIAKATLQRRQLKESERRERIFNDKVRTIGVDTEALDKQIQEKKKQEEAAEEKQNAYDAAMLQNSKVACLLHDKQVKDRRLLEKAIVNYRHQYQQQRSQQDFGKADQAAAQTMLPGLVGEDLESESRQQRQKEQVRAWLWQQQSEQASERHQRKLEEQCIDKSRVEMDSKAQQLQCLDTERRRSAALATKDYNLAKVKDKLCRRDCQKNRTHLQEQVTDIDTLTKHGMLGVPGLCVNSDINTPKESLQQVIQFQRFQMEEKKRIEMQKKQEEARLDRVRLDSAHAALLIERKQARLNKQLRQHMDSANMQLAETHRQQMPDIGRRGIDNSFFSGFNTCSR